MWFRYRAYSDPDSLHLVDEDEKFIDEYELSFQGSLETGKSWFMQRLSILEDVLKEKWSHAFLTSSWGIGSGVMYRRNYVDNLFEEISYPIVPMAIMLSRKEPTSNLAGIFAGSVVMTRKLEDYPWHVDYKKPFFYEHLNLMIFRLLENVIEDYDADELFPRFQYSTSVTHPKDNALFAAQVSAQFNVIVNFKSLADAKCLQEKLFQLDSFSEIKNVLAYKEKLLRDFGVDPAILPMTLQQINEKIHEFASEARQNFFTHLAI